MRALVTGATGFVGRHLVDRLIADGRDVATLLRSESVANDPACTRIVGSLDDVESARREIIEFAPDVIFHLAWAGVRSCDRDDPMQISTNLNGTMDLFQIAVESGCRVFVGLGSQAEYGPCDDVIGEDQRLSPNTLYGAAKASAGLILGRLASLNDVRLVWLRLFSCYGPGERATALVPDLIRRLKDGRPATLTDADRPWDYLYVSDAVEAIERCACSPEIRGTYNLASGQAMPLQEVAERLRDILKSESEIVSIRSPVPLPSLRADVSRLMADSGWSPSVRLDDGLRATVDAMTQQRICQPEPMRAGGGDR